MQEAIFPFSCGALLLHPPPAYIISFCAPENRKGAITNFSLGMGRILTLGQEISSRKDVGAAFMTPVSKRADQHNRDRLAS